MFKIQTKLILIISFIAVLSLTLTAYLIRNHPVRYAVFAGYNADKTIHPYVMTYLKGLNEVTDGVVYIADSELLEDEYKKLDGLVIHTEHKRHNEYDFGSYKRGFNWLQKNGYLKKADEIIFANDSAYAPMTSFKPMFYEMSKHKDLDFWGDLQNTRFNPHLQTYFIVFRKKVTSSKAFTNFINQIKHQPYSSMYITEYEVKLTQMLESLGYKWDSYMPYKELSFLKDYSDKNAFPLTLISRYHHQFLKRRTFTDSLPIFEDKTALLTYIKNNYPKRYDEIIKEISLSFLPKN